MLRTRHACRNSNTGGGRRGLVQEPASGRGWLLYLQKDVFRPLNIDLGQPDERNEPEVYRTAMPSGQPYLQEL